MVGGMEGQLVEAERRKSLAEAKLQAVMQQHGLQVEMLTGKVEELKAKLTIDEGVGGEPDEGGVPFLNPIEALRQELEDTRQQVDDLVAEKATLNSEKSALVGEKGALAAEKERLISENAVILEAKSAAERQKSLAEQAVEDLKKAQAEEKEVLEKQLADAKVRTAEVEDKLSDTRAKLRESEDALMESRAEAKRLRDGERERELQTTIDKLSKELTKMHGELCETKKAKFHLESDKGKLKKDVRRFKRESVNYNISPKAHRSPTKRRSLGKTKGSPSRFGRFSTFDRRDPDAEDNQLLKAMVRGLKIDLARAKKKIQQLKSQVGS